jgi:hypothetical protein
MAAAAMRVGGERGLGVNPRRLLQFLGSLLSALSRIWIATAASRLPLAVYIGPAFRTPVCLPAGCARGFPLLQIRRTLWCIWNIISSYIDCL